MRVECPVGGQLVSIIRRSWPTANGLLALLVTVGVLGRILLDSLGPSLGMYMYRADSMELYCMLDKRRRHTIELLPFFKH